MQYSLKMHEKIQLVCMISILTNSQYNNCRHKIKAKPGEDVGQPWEYTLTGCPTRARMLNGVIHI